MRLDDAAYMKRKPPDIICLWTNIRKEVPMKDFIIKILDLKEENLEFYPYRFSDQSG